MSKTKKPTSKAPPKRVRQSCRTRQEETSRPVFPEKLEARYWQAKRTLILEMIGLLLSDDEEVIAAMASEVFDPETDKFYADYIRASDEMESWAEEKEEEIEAEEEAAKKSRSKRPK